MLIVLLWASDLPVLPGCAVQKRRGHSHVLRVCVLVLDDIHRSVPNRSTAAGSRMRVVCADVFAQGYYLFQRLVFLDASASTLPFSTCIHCLLIIVFGSVLAICGFFDGSVVLPVGQRYHVELVLRYHCVRSSSVLLVRFVCLPDLCRDTFVRIRQNRESAERSTCSLVVFLLLCLCHCLL